MFIYIPKYISIACSVCIMLHIICMYVFSTDHFVLENQLEYSSLGKTISLILGIPSMPIVLCVKLRHPGLSPIHVSISVVAVLLYTYSGSNVGDSLCGVSEISEKYNLTENFMFL